MIRTNRSVILSLALAWGMASLGLAATIQVPAGGDFQDALNKANPGDILVLAAGATYSGPGFKLPNKGSSTQMITIQSSDLSVLPAAGYRVHPSDARNMPRLVATYNATPVIRALEGAHHYQFIGIEFAEAPGHWAYTMLEFGYGDETAVSQLPHHLVIDRCYIHGDPTAGTKRGIQLNGANIDVLNSYVSEIHVVGQDSQAIGSINGTGPFKIINNYLEASTENILFGGDLPRISGLIPSDIEIRNNYLMKPLAWNKSDPTYAGIPWSVKNLFELKNAQRVTVSGNVMENSWLQSQVGFAVVLTPRGEGGKAPWSAVRDVNFTHNIIRHCSSGISMLSDDDNGGSQPLQNILIKDNIIDDVNPGAFGGDGRLFQMVAPTRPALNVTIEHNTVLHNGSGQGMFTVGDRGTVGDQFVFSNNLVTHGYYGFVGSGTGVGTVALNAYFTHYTMIANAIIGNGVASKYPAGNFFPNNFDDAGFTNWLRSDYRLNASSPYKSKGTDGKDLGADVAAVLAATCGTVIGVPPSACASLPAKPVITSTTSASIDIGSAFSYQIAATNNPSSFIAWGLPTGLSINPGTGRISGTPRVVGRLYITVGATNGGGTGTSLLILTVIGDSGLTAPVLNLPATLPVNSVISASYSGTVPVDHYAWSFTPVAASASRQSPAAALATGAPSASFSTPGAQAYLASVKLGLSSYRISVRAVAGTGQISDAAQATVTFVSADLGGVRVYPNPWRSDRHPAHVTFDGMPLDTKIKIFTVSGHWLKTLPSGSTSATWDLTNDQGDTVASGLYLYLLTTNNEKKTGKIAVIR